jgi:hypothetical protein
MSEHLHINTDELRATLTEFNIQQYIVGEVMAIADSSSADTEGFAPYSGSDPNDTVLRVTEIDYAQEPPVPTDRELWRSMHFSENLRPGTRYLITKFFTEHESGRGKAVIDYVWESVVFDDENPETDALHGAYTIS